MTDKIVSGIFRTKTEIDGKPVIVAIISGSKKTGLTLEGGHMHPGKPLLFGEQAPFQPDAWIRLRVCPGCGSTEIEKEDRLNPCANAACKLNGVHTYHLGCGSQHKDFCACCGAVLFDSAEDEIESVKWEAVEYICSQCETEGVQPGHFACGQTYRVPA